MNFKKTLVFFSLFLFVAVPFYFFVVLYPINEFQSDFKQAPMFVRELINKTYPNDLVIDIKNGQVSLNKETPYCLKIDDKSRTGILFDENANPTSFIGGKSSNYSKLCNPVILVGNNFFVYPDTQSNTQGSYKIQEIPQNINYKITQDEINKLSSENLPFLLNIGEKIYYFGPLVFSLLTLLLFLSNNLWYALIAKLFLKITKIKNEVTFKEVYSKTFFSLFVYTILDWIIIKLIIVNLLKINFHFSFPFLTTIIVVTITLLLEKFYFRENI